MARPPKYKTAAELQKKIDEFFDDSSNARTISGLCYHVGFASRQSFYDLEAKEEFTYTIKRARLRIEMDYEKSLRENGRAGDIFALKNFGWSDRQDIDHTTKGEKLGQLNVTVDSSETAETLKKLRDGCKAD